MVDTFSALVSDLLDDIGTSVASQASVLAAFARWHDLLATRDALSADVEQGLWGELKVLLRIPDIDGAEAAWNGPIKGVIDLLRGKIGVEVKTGRRRRHHTITFDQALFGSLDYEAYLLSLWVQPDEAGETIVDLIDSIGDRLIDDARFRKKLRGLGYREEDADRYQMKLRLVEEPAAFPMHLVPRIEHVPDGASNVRWDVDLNSKAELDDAELTPLWAKISGAIE
jgi:hypothetical protein